MTVTAGTAYVAAEWLIRVTMAVLIPARRPPAAARSWLLLILFLPIPGVLLFAAIGRPAFPAWRAARFRDLSPFLARVVQRLAPGAAPADPAADPADAAVIALAGELGGLPAVGGNRVELLDDYDATIDRLIADIDAARRHVRVLVYIFADDATGQKVIAALGRAVARGVACHVLFDPVGSHRWRRGTRRRLAAAGVAVRQSLPVKLLRARTRGDMRNHRKLFVVDGAIGYGGSQNLVGKSFRAGVVNRELVVRIEGPAVAAMTAVFLADWYLETEAMLDDVEVPPDRGDAVVQLLPSGASYPLAGFETLLVWAIHNARRRVIVTTPYFIPDEGLLSAMRTAVLRGVAVDLIVSAVADQKLVRLAQQSYYDALLAAGVRVHRYGRFLLHAKNLSIDGRFAVVGSSNVDVRSFQLNEEVSVLLFDAGTVAAVEAVQRRALAASSPLDLATWRRRPAWLKPLEDVARLLGPLL